MVCPSFILSGEARRNYFREYQTCGTGEICGSIILLRKFKVSAIPIILGSSVAGIVIYG